MSKEDETLEYWPWLGDQEFGGYYGTLLNMDDEAPKEPGYIQCCKCFKMLQMPTVESDIVLTTGIWDILVKGESWRAEVTPEKAVILCPECKDG